MLGRARAVLVAQLVGQGVEGAEEASTTAPHPEQAAWWWGRVTRWNVDGPWPRWTW